MKALRLARHAADAILTVTLAPTCAACGGVLDAPLSGPVCAACWAGVRVLVHRDVPARTPPAAWQAAADHDGPFRNIVHAFKYDGRRSLADPLASLMREAGGDLLRAADLVVPVPLHPWRRLQRGFNQAGDLATRLDVPVVHALWRTRATAPQTMLDSAERHRNVRGAFRVSPLVRRSRLAGARIVLVDDVRTTGATLDACARVLLRAGAESVSALTAARAPGRAAPSGST